jgi:hypothetical protein
MSRSDLGGSDDDASGVAGMEGQVGFEADLG